MKGRGEDGLTHAVQPAPGAERSAEMFNCKAGRVFPAPESFPSPAAQGIVAEETRSCLPCSQTLEQLRTFPVLVFLGIKFRKVHRHAVLSKPDAALNFFRKRLKLYSGGVICHFSTCPVRSFSDYV